jgi:uncharacterized membrane protein YoaK (UPF0700 family)
MPVASPIARRYTVVALLTLTAVTGLVDAVSYLRLGRVFVANMTGNVVFLGFSADHHSGLSPVASLIAIGGFVAGAFGGGRAAHHFAHRTRDWLSVALGSEAGLLGLTAVLAAVGVLPLDGHGRYATIVVLAVSLGVQNSTIRHFGVPDLTTTVLTLTLTGLTADSTLAGGTGAKPHRRLGSVAAMLGGAAAGALLLQASVSGVIAVAAALAAVVAAMFGFGPASPAEQVSPGGAGPDLGQAETPDPGPGSGSSPGPGSGSSSRPYSDPGSGSDQPLTGGAPA